MRGRGADLGCARENIRRNRSHIGPVQADRRLSPRQCPDQIGRRNPHRGRDQGCHRPIDSSLARRSACARLSRKTRTGPSNLRTGFASPAKRNSAPSAILEKPCAISASEKASRSKLRLTVTSSFSAHALDPATATSATRPSMLATPNRRGSSDGKWCNCTNWRISSRLARAAKPSCIPRQLATHRGSPSRHLKSPQVFSKKRASSKKRSPANFMPLGRFGADMAAAQ